MTPESDFFRSRFGLASTLTPRLGPISGLLDGAWDAAIELRGGRRRLIEAAAADKKQRVLIVGVVVPYRPRDIHHVVERLSRSRHDVAVSLVDMGDCGKFENINAAIAAAPEPLSAFDWLVVTDDDVEFDDDFLDNYLAIAAAADFALSQPAHRFASFASFALTRRRFASLVRETRFVESGPLCVVRSDAFSDLVPFPVSRWSYGVDVIWSTLSARRGWRMGIIDGMAIRHCRPVGATYDTDAARKEGQALIDRHGATGKRRVLLTSQKGERGVRTLVTVCRQALTGLQRSFLTPSAGPPAALSEPDLPEAPV